MLSEVRLCFQKSGCSPPPPLLLLVSPRPLVGDHPQAASGQFKVILTTSIQSSSILLEQYLDSDFKDLVCVPSYYCAAQIIGLQTERELLGQWDVVPVEDHFIISGLFQ